MKKVQKMKQGNNNFFIHHVIIVLFFGFLSACSGTRKLPDGQFLYTGATVHINSEARVPGKSQLTSDLESLVKPEPNGSIFGMRPRLWIHNITRDTTGSGGLKGWINRKLGDPPVLISQTNPTNSENLIQNRLYNNGYFEAEVDHEIIYKKRTAHVNYIADVNSPYTVDTVIFPNGNDVLRRAIYNTQDESVLEIGDLYNVDNLTEERNRISRQLRDSGFYYFAPEHMIFRVDSTIGDRQVRIFLNVKDGLPEDATTQFRMNNILINPNYSFQLDTIDSRADTLNVDDYGFIRNNRRIKPKVLTRSMFLQPDSIYSRTGHEQSINRLMGLGVFQYANIRFNQVGKDQLDAVVLLTPVKRKSFRAELQGVTSSFYYGPNLNVSFQNKNIFGGAELFELKLTSGLELGTGGERSNFTSYNYGLEASIHFPRFIVPFFRIDNKSSHYVPQTRIRVGFQRTNRVEFFKANSFNISAGYVWNETRKVRHELNVMDINFFQLVDTTGAFHRRLQEFEFQQKNYEEQFILSTNYSYTFNNQMEEWRTHNVFFNGLIDVSGNLMHLLQSSFQEEPSTADNQYTIFNRAYSQYLRFSTDFRYYYSIDRNNKIATRLFIGVGLPYGNSNSMPFIKQFFTGGTNSVRAFEARSVGPGLVTPEETSAGFFDQLGDMKIEGNIEYRFPIYSVFKGALFLEAGNIWMISDESEMRGRFNIDNFIKELAVGTGFGLRLDVDFFLLRFDFGVPLRVPHGWVWDELPASVDRDWNNITFNIGIGYPF